MNLKMKKKLTLAQASYDSTVSVTLYAPEAESTLLSFEINVYFPFPSLSPPLHFKL